VAGGGGVERGVEDGEGVGEEEDVVDSVFALLSISVYINAGQKRGRETHPMASTRNGITSATTSVVFTPAAEQRATEVETERRTIRMPTRPAHPPHSLRQHRP
jgi:hypothetical protein